MAVIPILTCQRQKAHHPNLSDHHQFRLVLSLLPPSCLLLLLPAFVLRNKVSEPDSRESYEAEVDGVEEVPFLSLDEHEGPAEEDSENEKKTDPDGDGLGDIDLLPVLVLKLVKELSSSRPDPRRGDSPGRCGHLDRVTTEHSECRLHLH